MDRLDLKFMMIALDEKTHKYLLHYPDVFTVNYKTLHNITNNSENFRSIQFNVISKLKMEAAYLLLKQGYDVIFMDTDVIVVTDFLDLFIWDNVDYVHGIADTCKASLS